MLGNVAHRGVSRRRAALVVLVALVGGLFSMAPARAVLTQLGPLDATGFPNWYADDAGVRVQLCVDAAPPCFTGRPDLANPPSATNLPLDGEAFYFDGEADMSDARGGQLTFMRLALEATYVGGQPGDPAAEHATFGRVRFRLFGLVPGASYTMTYPYGTKTFTADAAGKINDTQDIGCFGANQPTPCAQMPAGAGFDAALSSGILRFLQWDPAVAPAAPAGYLGVFGTPHRIIGSPVGQNFWRVTGPNIGGLGVNTIQTDLFDVAGKLAATPPGAPGALSVTAGPGAGQLSLSWSAPVDDGGSAITGYRVFRGTTSGALTALTPDLPAGTTSFTDGNLGAGATRFYTVAAINQVGAGTPTVEVSGTTFQVPSAPRTLVASAGPGAGQISLSWAAPTSSGGGALTAYNVYAGSSATTLALLTNVAPTATSFVESGLANGTPRFYAVTAVNVAGESLRSNQADATTFNVPSPVRTLAANAGPARGQINLTWQAPASNGGTAITGYRVLRGTTSGALSAIGPDLPATALSFTDSGLGDGATRIYAVAALNGAGLGDRSNEASATTFGLPGAPQSAVATAGPAAGQIRLSWLAPASTGGTTLTGYRIYRGATSGALALLTEVPGSATSFTDSGLPEATTQFYAVTALNTVGEGVRSAVASAATFARPSVPTAFSANAGPTAGQITLTWNPPVSDGGSAITGYRIFRGTASGALAPIGELTSAARSFTDSGLGDGVTRFYSVAALNGVGEGVHAAEAVATTFSVPSAPLNPTATAGAGQISLAWSAPANTGGATISGFRVYRGSASGVLTQITQVGGGVLSFVDSGLPESATRFYAITALNPAGESVRSVEVSATTFSRPAAPRSIDAVTGPGVGQITVNWGTPLTNGGTSVTAFRVYSGDASGALTLRSEVPAGSFSFTDAGLPPGATRFYQVTSVNAVGEGAPTAEVHAVTFDKPAAPSAPGVNRGPGLGQLTVTWGVPATDGGRPVQAFRIYRGTESGALTRLADVGPSVRSYTDSGLPAGATRFYAVTAINAVGESVRTLEVSGMTFAKPGAPQNVTARPGPAVGWATVSWDPPADDGGRPVSGYRIYRAEGSGAFSFVQSVTAAARSWNDTGRALLTVYRYRVAAVNEVGESTPSPDACTLAFPAPPLLACGPAL